MIWTRPLPTTSPAATRTPPVNPGSKGKKLFSREKSLPEKTTTWGPPQLWFSDGQGGQVLVYTPAVAGNTTNGEIGGLQRYRSATVQTVYKPSMTARWPVYRMFFVDANNRIYRWAWRGRWDVP